MNLSSTPNKYDPKSMRVGVISPNLVDDGADYLAAQSGGGTVWPLEALAKKVSVLFDKIYLTHDLDVTCEIVGGYEENERTATLRYLADKGLLFQPQELGYLSGESFVNGNVKGLAAKLHKRLVRIGNPYMNEEPGEMKYIGQPDIGDFDASNGWHPRSRIGWNDPKIKIRKMLYESLLIQRNVELLRVAGFHSVSIVGKQYDGRTSRKDGHPVWKIILKEMPELDTRAPWEDIFGFRQEERTQHLVRAVRRWIRKIIVEDWTEPELEDEIRELVYEYERHLRVCKIWGSKGLIEVFITGVAELTEDLVKFRLAKVAKLVSAMVDRGAKMLQAEAEAPGRELALIPELRERF